MNVETKKPIPGLSRRLAYLASELDQSVIADIGCDHGLVCIEAIRQGKVKKAYACDLRELPLKQAEENIHRFDLQDVVFPRLRSGIHDLEGDVEQILIAGMGGRMIEEILEADPLPDSVRSLLLSPHKDADHLRQWLIDHRYCIVEESVIEDGHFYPVLHVLPPERSGSDSCSLSEKEKLFGKNPALDQEYRNWLLWQIGVWSKIADGVDGRQRELFDHRIELAESILKQF